MSAFEFLPGWTVGRSEERDEVLVSGPSGGAWMPNKGTVHQRILFDLGDAIFKARPNLAVCSSVPMRAITRDEVAAENARQQAANRYTNIDPYVKEDGIDAQILEAIKARIDGVFDHPGLKAFGPLSDTLSDVIRIAEEGLRRKCVATATEDAATDEDEAQGPRP